MKYKYGICGAFDFEEKSTGGQSVKTREFYYALQERVGSEQIKILESTGYKKNPMAFFAGFVSLLRQCEHVIIFPANKGIRIFAPLCALLKGLCGTKVHYNVIGGWLAQLVEGNASLKKHLMRFDTILVETSFMKAELEAMGFTNVKVLANFKRIEPIEASEIRKTTLPVRLCYFSRVTKLKGIEDAANAVIRLNAGREQPVCTFDIYGPVADGYDEEFDALSQTFTPEISYMGKIDPRQSVLTISRYDIQLFPTRYATEGIPGSILDSFFAGVPVLAAKWNSFSDIVNDGVTGVGYEQGNAEDLREKLHSLIGNPETIQTMKENCLRESQKYLPANVMNDFLSIIKE